MPKGIPNKKPQAQAAVTEGPAVVTAPKGRRTVTVASKLPMDLDLQLCRETTARVTGQYGSVTEQINLPFGPVVTIRGTAYPAGTPPKGFPRPPHMISAGYALTHNVDADFWDRWIQQNSATDMVVNGMIKAHSDLDHLEGEAEEFKDRNSGMEPMNPEGDRRSPQPITLGVAKIKTEPRNSFAV